MTELKVNLQGSWKRILAMITVAAMCFTVIYVSPVSAATQTVNATNVKLVTGAEVSAASITVSPVTATVSAGESVTLEGVITVTPGEVTVTEAKWTSEDDAVATVDANGKVTAKADVTTEKMVKVALSATVDGVALTPAECDVTVKAAAQKPTDPTNPTDPTSPSAGPSTSPTGTTAGTVVAPKVGEQKVVSGVTYKVAKNNTVTYQKPKKNAKKVTVPATVKINGKTYKVTAVANNAFKGNKKVKTVTVGKNVTTIGAGAFQNCKALTKVTLPAKAKTIGKNAFANSKKLKTIVIKSTKMTNKTIKNGAFKKVSKKVTVDVPNKKAKTYKKLFQKKGLPKACKVK